MTTKARHGVAARPALRQHGPNELRQSPWEVGKDRKRSEMVVKLQMPSGKRDNDDGLRNASEFFFYHF